jgi:hypothetical protein
MMLLILGKGICRIKAFMAQRAIKQSKRAKPNTRDSRLSRSLDYTHHEIEQLRLLNRMGEYATWRPQTEDLSSPKVFKVRCPCCSRVHVVPGPGMYVCPDGISESRFTAVVPDHSKDYAHQSAQDYSNGYLTAMPYLTDKNQGIGLGVPQRGGARPVGGLGFTTPQGRAVRQAKVDLTASLKNKPDRWNHIEVAKPAYGPDSEIDTSVNSTNFGNSAIFAASQPNPHLDITNGDGSGGRRDS